MKYKQIKKNGVEGFSEKPSIPIFFYLLIKEKRFEKNWLFLVQIYLPAYLKKKLVFI